jgi:hypothetical protein
LVSSLGGRVSEAYQNREWIFNRIRRETRVYTFPRRFHAERGAEMGDPAGIILVVLIGILAVFIIVRLVKLASRTVDREQDEKVQARSPEPLPHAGQVFCPKCGKGVSEADSFCRFCGVRFLPEKST